MCLNFCSTLRDRGCKYSFSLKLGHGFDFSLASEECPPKQAKKRSPSYRRRQERRRADYLQKQSKSSHDKEATASGSPNQDRTTAEAEQLNLCPTPVHTRYSIGSMDSEEDDATMENACTNTLAEKSEDRALQNQSDTNSKESDVHGSDTEGGSDASSAESSSDEGGSDATTEDPESHWEQVSSRRGRGLPGRRQPSPSAQTSEKCCCQQQELNPRQLLCFDNCYVNTCVKYTDKKSIDTCTYVDYRKNAV